MKKVSIPPTSCVLCDGYNTHTRFDLRNRRDVFSVRYALVICSAEDCRSWLSAVSCRPDTAEARVRYQVNPCEICGAQSVTVTDFSPSTSVFACQYHSTNAAYPSASHY